MDPKQSKTLGYLLLLCCVLPLVALFLYMYLWSTRNITPENLRPGGGAGTPVRPLAGTPAPPGMPTPPAPAAIKAHLRVPVAQLSLRDLRETGGLFSAEFSLVNPGPGTVRVLDAIGPELIEVRILYLGEDGQASPSPLVPAEQPARSAASAAAFQAVTLLPGRRLVLAVNLSPRFTLDLPGRYRVSAHYAPDAYATAHQLNLQSLGLPAQRVEAPAVEFEAR